MLSGRWRKYIRGSSEILCGQEWTIWEKSVSVRGNTVIMRRISHMEQDGSLQEVGRIDLTGKPLAEAAYTKTAFELMEKPVIAVCPVNHTGEKHSPSAWKMSNAIESWSWDGCSGKKAQVEVYARADRVELFINGKSVGSKKMKNDCRTSFDVIYEEGIIEAISYDAQNREIARNVLYTAGKKRF